MTPKRQLTQLVLTATDIFVCLNSLASYQVDLWPVTAALGAIGWPGNFTTPI